MHHLPLTEVSFIATDCDVRIQVTPRRNTHFGVRVEDLAPTASQEQTEFTSNVDTDNGMISCPASHQIGIAINIFVASILTFTVKDQILFDAHLDVLWLC